VLTFLKKKKNIKTVNSEGNFLGNSDNISLIENKSTKKNAKEKQLSFLFKGFSLAELIVAIGIFLIIAPTLIIFAIDATKVINNSQSQIDASNCIKSISSIITMKKSDSWRSIIELVDQGNFYFDTVENNYAVLPGEGTCNGFDYYFNVTNALRDTDGNIIDIGGTPDVRTKKIAINVSWTDKTGSPQNLDSNIFLNNWNTYEWKLTTVEDFSAGTLDSTRVVNNAGGEVKMETVVYADWCKPTLTTTTFDLPGQGVAKAVKALPGDINVGTGDNASGMSLIDLSITQTLSPTVTLDGTFDGYKVNDLFSDDHYVYLATDENSKEAVIVDKSVSPPVEVGYFNTPNNDDGNGIVVVGNYGYLLTDDKLYKFDLSSKTGSRSQVGSPVNVYITGHKIIVNGNYGYVAMSNILFQLMIVDLTTFEPVALTKVNWRYVTDLYVNQANTRVYMVTQNSSSAREFFVIDVTNKSGFPPVISSFDLGGMSATGITVIEDNNRVLISGTGGTYQYQVLDITNEYNISRCGGVAISASAYDVASVKDAMGNVYSYLVTGNSSAELQIIRGGPGGGDGTGYGYNPTATYQSMIFDAGIDDAYFVTFEPVMQIISGSNIQFQVRSGDTPDLSSVSYVGPDGTSATYFDGSAIYVLPETISPAKYFQYIAYFTSDTAHTSILEESKLRYEK